MTAPQGSGGAKQPQATAQAPAPWQTPYGASGGVNPSLGLANQQPWNQNTLNLQSAAGARQAASSGPQVGDPASLVQHYADSSALIGGNQSYDQFSKALAGYNNQAAAATKADILANGANDHPGDVFVNGTWMQKPDVPAPSTDPNAAFGQRFWSNVNANPFYTRTPQGQAIIQNAVSGTPMSDRTANSLAGAGPALGLRAKLSGLGSNKMGQASPQVPTPGGTNG